MWVYGIVVTLLDIVKTIYLDVVCINYAPVYINVFV